MLGTADAFTTLGTGGLTTGGAGGSTTAGGSRRAFGATTLVTLRLAAGRIPAKGPIAVRIANANGFRVTGELSGQTAKRASRSRTRRVKLTARSFRVGAHAAKAVKLTLPRSLRAVLNRSGKVSLRVVAKVEDPAGTTRTIRKRILLRVNKNAKRNR